MMTRIELDALRLRCRAAFEVYQARVARVIEQSKGGEMPPDSELDAEEQALYEYAKVRRDLLDALRTIYRPSH